MQRIIAKDYFNDLLENNATVLLPNQGEKLELKDIDFTFKVTSEMSNDQLGVYKIMLKPMAIGAKLHYHRFMDETFIVDKGILTVQAGEEIIKAPPGSIVYVPRFTPHSFQNDTDEFVELTLLFNPSQKREGFFRGLLETLSEDPIDPEKYLKLYNKYDSFPVDTSNMIPTRD
ncbi:cupin domain-containing protein [Muricauda sp. 2012CJ35-5]|uniref:Cupin domain-containing protein n=1 Tax=Flagellimonas spongiicola TaxID=2942208 RepID=A0ABT0PYU0_9FLAO|nr:cupin domain-containing protein [Allomuricauda spongiicola]MCL6275623.1 cupin domain-containing protein [Allomuricauda spongiicola]